MTVSHKYNFDINNNKINENYWLTALWKQIQKIKCYLMMFHSGKFVNGWKTLQGKKLHRPPPPPKKNPRKQKQKKHPKNKRPMGHIPPLINGSNK